MAIDGRVVEELGGLVETFVGHGSVLRGGVGTGGDTIRPLHSGTQRAQRQRWGNMHRPRVVIVGAGFGGIAAASALADTPVDVTIVDQHNFHTFSPLLYQVATSSLAPDDIAPNLRGIVRNDPNIEARMNTVRGVDFERREVLVDGDAPLAYDYLVLAAGAVSSDFGVPGAAEHAIPLKTLADASKIRSTVLARFEEADADPSRVDDGTLTFVVAGGGPTGVELCGALGELITLVLREGLQAPRRRPGAGRPGRDDRARPRHVLCPLAGRKRRSSWRSVASRCASAWRSPSVADDRVELADGTVIPTRTVLWTAGVKANPVASALSLAQTARGEIVVRPDLSVPGHPEVFVIGDLAAVERPDGTPFPQLAPVAIQQGRYVAREHRAPAAGEVDEALPLRRQGHDGRPSGAARRWRSFRSGIRFGGTLGWLSWLGLHLVFLIGFRNRAVVLLNWAWNYLRWDHGNRVILSDDGVTPRSGRRGRGQNGQPAFRPRSSTSMAVNVASVKPPSVYRPRSPAGSADGRYPARSNVYTTGTWSRRTRPASCCWSSVKITARRCRRGSNQRAMAVCPYVACPTEPTGADDLVDAGEHRRAAEPVDPRVVRAIDHHVDVIGARRPSPSPSPPRPRLAAAASGWRPAPASSPTCR